MNRRLRAVGQFVNPRMSYWYFVRARGRDFLQTIEPWLKIALGSSALTLYGGGTVRQSLWVLVGVIVASEVFMVCWGIYDHRAGNMERQQSLNNLQDPWKVETLDLLRSLAHHRAVPDPPTCGVADARQYIQGQWQTARQMTQVHEEVG